jgi:hypothetical protein
MPAPALCCAVLCCAVPVCALYSRAGYQSQVAVLGLPLQLSPEEVALAAAGGEGGTWAIFVAADGVHGCSGSTRNRVTRVIEKLEWTRADAVHFGGKALA